MTNKQKALEAATRVFKDCATNRAAFVIDTIPVENLGELDRNSTKSIIAAYLNELDASALVWRRVP